MPRAALGERGESVLDKGGKCFSLFHCSILLTRYVVPGMTILIFCFVMFVASSLGEHDGDTTTADDESKTSFFAFFFWISLTAHYLLSLSCRYSSPCALLKKNCGIFPFFFSYLLRKGSDGSGMDTAIEESKETTDRDTLLSLIYF